MESLEWVVIGYGGGLFFSVDFGCLEVEIGVIYVVCYYLVGIVYVRGSLLLGLCGDELCIIELNMFSILLYICYDYFQYNKWWVYVFVGGAVQVVF